MSVALLTKPDDRFSALYLQARKKEHRVLNDAQVAALPDIDLRHPHYREWQLRKKSAERFRRYLEKRSQPMSILDVGCGNGWFSNLMAGTGHNILAIDVNLPELEQASRVFGSPNLKFAFADIFALDLSGYRFDLIVLNSSFQYFRYARKTIAALRNLLTTGGEIHIIDTPFYREDQIAAARQRTAAYYAGLGFPDMAANYFHHTLADLGRYEILYRPSPLNFVKKDSPFYWIQIR